MSFKKEMIQLVHSHICEEDVDIVLTQLANKYQLSFRELANCYVNMLWSDIDGTDENEILDIFIKENFNV